MQRRPLSVDGEPRRLERPLPDAARLTNDPRLGHLELNHRITAGYGQLATRLQSLVDPDFARSETSSLPPVWYAFGAYASRQAGLLLLDAELASTFLDAGGDRRSVEALLRFHPAASGETRTRLEARIEGCLSRIPERPRWARFAGDFLLSSTFASGAFAAMNLSALLDPRALVIVLDRISAVVGSAPDPAARVLHTLSQGLAQANRDIFRRVGGFGERFFRRRSEAGAPLAWRDILAECAPEGARDVDRTKHIWDATLSLVSEPRSGPVDFTTVFPGCTADELLTVAFSLYERAGRSAATEEKRALIVRANELAGFAEQRFFAQPAFAPGKVLEGEVDREALFGALTPLIQLCLPMSTWRFSRYAREALPARDPSLLTPHVTEYNWARFEDRWPAILAFFEEGYVRPRRLWPMPPGDPASTEQAGTGETCRLTGADGRPRESSRTPRPPALPQA